MAITSGFFNSLNGDRKYNAEQMSELFNGIITDGVFANIGSAFEVKAIGDNNVTVGLGRAWFDGKWINNDSLHSVTLDAPNVIYDRWDALVFDIDKSEMVRSGTIRYVKGSESTSPSRPDLVKTDEQKQYPIAYIFRKASSVTVEQADIYYCIGGSECPFVTGILKTVDISAIVAQWEDQWTQWFVKESSSSVDELDSWMTESKASFVGWFEALQSILDEDTAANLASEILRLNEKFDMLVREGAIDDNILDSDGSEIKGSDETSLVGRVTIASGAGGSSSTSREQLIVQLGRSDWIEDSEAYLGRTIYRQTVECAGATEDMESYLPMIRPVGEIETDLAEKEAYECISYIDIQDDHVKVVCYESRPDSDIKLYLVKM